MTNATAMTVAWSAKYDPFGVPFAVTVSPVNTQRLPGQWFQLEDGLSYNWHRTYDPTLGPYTQADPLGFVDGPGIYNYVGGSPVMGVDPRGLNPAVGMGLRFGGQALRRFGGGGLSGLLGGGGGTALGCILFGCDPMEPYYPPAPSPIVPAPMCMAPPDEPIRMPEIWPPAPPPTGCRCNCRAGDPNNPSSYGFATATAPSCPIAAKTACSIANARASMSNTHHSRAVCSDGKSYSGGGRQN